ncbi:hypothetical protein [Clavibacter sp. VKM Ac-2542]|uniref:hypothetical protein n=1 Tax=Clavibacter TaxID=1573 RepID=UPI00188B7AD9|nr:hypothetical protein [Clavibacter sp. VKM Ac-2542]MBF4621618.1 hypothetical protein [Clavibacter sp. VKM Ac-2542]
MQDTGTDDMGDPVQSSASETLPPRPTGPGRSPTEQARFVAGYFGWSMTGDEIREPDGTVALYIEDLAVALTDLHWISDDGIRWDLMPFDELEAADALRVAQRARGWEI